MDKPIDKTGKQIYVCTKLFDKMDIPIDNMGKQFYDYCKLFNGIDDVFTVS